MSEHKGGDTGHHDEHEEPLVEVRVLLEEDQIGLLEEIAGEYTKKLGQKWDLSAVVRLAVGDLLTKLGKLA